MAEFIAENEVKSKEVVELKTPGGQNILKVEYKNTAESELITESKFNIIRTANRGDASKARDLLVQKVGAQMYALLMEYGVTVAEVDPIINEAIRLVNHAQDEANDILWGVSNAYKRTLIDVNRVLLTKYGKPLERPQANA